MVRFGTPCSLLEFSLISLSYRQHRTHQYNRHLCVTLSVRDKVLIKSSTMNYSLSDEFVFFLSYIAITASLIQWSIDPLLTSSTVIAVQISFALRLRKFTFCSCNWLTRTIMLLSMLQFGTYHTMFLLCLLIILQGERYGPPNKVSWLLLCFIYSLTFKQLRR
jgi:hypothetical protein